MNHHEFYDQALMHLATALALAKRVIFGHGLNSQLDLRPDLLGELINAECALKIFNCRLFPQFSQFRQVLQMRGMDISQQDIDRLRQFYLLVEERPLLEMTPSASEDSCSDFATMSIFENSPSSNICPATITSEKSIPAGNETQDNIIIATVPPPYHKYTKPLDVVIPLGNGSKNDNWEIRFALRSLEQNVKNIGNIYIMSCYAPDWLQNVTIIPVPDKHKRNKDANLIDKVLAACRLTELSDDFLRMSDDQVCINAWDALDSIPVHNGRNPEFLIKRKWQRRLHRTWQYLVAHGVFIDYNWDAHVPQPYNKIKFLELIENANYEEPPGYCINTLYFGLLHEKKRIEQNEIKVTIENGGAINIDSPPNKVWLGYNDSGLANGLFKWLSDKFPNKCKYEKY